MLSAIAIFIVIFLIYLHWVEQYKTGEDLEIYEIDYSNIDHLQEVCKSKQPIIFEFSSIISKLHFLNTITLDDLADKYGKMDIFIKDTDDYFATTITESERNIDSIPLTLDSSLKLLSTDTHSHYISEGNGEFINDTFLEKYYDSLHEYIKPSMTIHKQMDLCFGSKGSSTPLRYNTDFSHFIYVPKGKLRVKMTPQKSKKYLHTIKDYFSYEFYSPVHCWNPQQEYSNEAKKIQFLDFDVYEGHMLFIPPYWWYSLQYEEEGTFFYSIKYNTIMNAVANSHNIGNYLYQQYTTRTKPAKVLKIEEREQKTEEITVPIL
jgi:hypothetical protein